VPECIRKVCETCAIAASATCVEDITDRFDTKKITETDPTEDCSSETLAYATSECYSELLANCKVTQEWLDACVKDVCSASTAGDPDPLSVADDYCDNQDSLDEEGRTIAGWEELTTTLPPVVDDTSDWTNNGGETCADYEANGWCKDGSLVAGYEGKAGEANRFPELNCAVCGKDEQVACYEMNTQYNNNDEITRVKNIPSPTACQVSCQNNAQCLFWTWNPNRNKCILMTSNAGRKTKDPSAGERALVSGPKYCQDPLQEPSLDCAARSGVETSDHTSKCLMPATFQQCEAFGRSLPGGAKVVEVGAWGDAFPKFCSLSLIGSDVHMWWNNNTGDGDAARDPNGQAYLTGSCCDTSARRICCGDFNLPATPAPTPGPTPPPTPETSLDDPPLDPDVDTTVTVVRPPNPVYDLCQVYGDPHIVTFDASGGKSTTVSFYAYGTFWLVKSSAVWIQGYYRSIDLVYPGLSYLTKLALGGPFLKGNRLMIEGTAAGAQVWWNDGLILPGSGPGTHREMNGALVAERTIKVKGRKTKQKIQVEFPDAVKVTFVAFPKSGKVTFLNGVIKMLQVMGQDGQCGNFNLDAADDAEELIKQRGFSEHVAPDQLLIPS